jgi:hypothetical protein
MKPAHRRGKPVARAIAVSDRMSLLLFGLTGMAALAGGAIGSHLARFKLKTIHIRRIIGGLEYLMALKILRTLPSKTI